MSLHYILDGYNITNQLPVKSLDSLEDQRRNLVSLIETKRPQGSVRNKVTIVFDGQLGIESPRMSGSVNVIFSKGEIADNKIRNLAEMSPNKSSVIVVTDDREIQYAVRASGAKTIGVKEFLSKSNRNKEIKGSKKKRLVRSENYKNISKVVESEITSEMKKIWLDKK